MEEDPNIILINAHDRTDTQRIRIHGYDTCQKSETNQEDDGVAIAIKKGIRDTIIDDLEESYLACVISTDTYDVCVGSGYQPPR